MIHPIAQARLDLEKIIELLAKERDERKAEGFQAVPFYLQQAITELSKGLVSLDSTARQRQLDKEADDAMQRMGGKHAAS